MLLLAGAGPGAGAAGCVAVELLLTCFERVVFCLRWSTTAGAFAVGFGGAAISVSALLGPPLGAVLDGLVADAGVVVLGAVVVVVVVFAGSSLGVSLGVVVVTVPSAVGALSAADAPPGSDTRPPALSPPPASADSSARHAHLRDPG